MLTPGARASAVLLASVTVLSTDCRKVSSQDIGSTVAVRDALDGGQASALAPRNGVRARSPRCPKGGLAVLFGDAAAPADMEVGGAQEYEGGFAVGFARRGRETGKGAVALLGPRAIGVDRVVELGVIAEDAPAPVVAPGDGQLFAATFAAVSRDGARFGRRELRVYTIRTQATALVASFPAGSSESMAADIASSGRAAFVVWDATSTAGRGVIRGAPVTAAALEVAPRDISAPETDAESPRIVTNGAGYSVLWIARATSEAPVGDASEIAGEERAFTWLQDIEIDSTGSRVGTARDLTSRTGHVSGFDVRNLAGTLVVVARDDGENVDGSGGTLLRVSVRGSHVDAAQDLDVGPLGRGPPSLVDGSPPWLTWDGPGEQSQLLPLDDMASPAGPVSVEDALAEARPLAVSPPSQGLPERWLVATPLDPAAPLHWLTCALANHGDPIR